MGGALNREPFSAPPSEKANQEMSDKLLGSKGERETQLKLANLKESDKERLKSTLQGLKGVHVDIKPDGTVTLRQDSQRDLVDCLLDVLLEGLGLSVDQIEGGEVKLDVDKPQEQKVEHVDTPEEALFKSRMKSVSLVLLTLQNCIIILSLKYSRQPANLGSDGLLYLTTTAVVLGEVLKIFVALSIILFQKGSFGGLIKEIQVEMVEKPVECAKLLVPSLLYSVQNNLMFAAMSYISAAAFQCTMQLKILTTAIFSVMLLGRKLHAANWGGLAVLALGCILVNLDQTSSGVRKATPQASLDKQILGVVFTITAACTSGLAGVYFEKLLKGAKTCLWIRQIQLALGGVVIGSVGVWATDRERIAKDGFFQGYNLFTWWIIFFSSMGGFIIAVVVKYADNLYKAFAVSASIILSTIVSVPLFDFSISALFFIGAIFVVLSIFIYEKMLPYNLKTYAAFGILLIMAGPFIRLG